MGNFGKTITYLFVDGSNFRKYFTESTMKWFGQEVEFDFQKIKDFFQAEKAFYYDCIDDVKGDSESQKDFEIRVQTQEEKLNKIREVEGCHVHLGSISGKNKKKRQKEVDVMLAVQMMEHSFRGNMQKAVLLSGDKDFRPLVESLVRLGLFVEVVGDKNHISQDLIHAADSHKKLDFDDYYEWADCESSWDKTPPIIVTGSPSFYGNNPPKLVKTGIYKQLLVELHEYPDTEEGLIYTINLDDPEDFNRTYLWSGSQNNVELYFELKYGKIDWK